MMLTMSMKEFFLTERISFKRIERDAKRDGGGGGGGDRVREGAR